MNNEENNQSENLTRNDTGSECNDLLASGYKWDKESEIWWSPSSTSSGAARYSGYNRILNRMDHKWACCSMFDNGEIQYGNELYETALEAAEKAILFFS